MIEKTSLNYIHLPPNLALWVTLSGSNYPCLEQIYMLQEIFELLRFDCIWNTFYVYKSPIIRREANSSMPCSISLGDESISLIHSATKQNLGPQ